MIRPWMVVMLVVPSAAPGCTEDAPDGAGLLIETPAEQPESAALGVTVAIHARGGGGLAVAVDRGTLVAPAAAGNPAMGQEAGCFHAARPTSPFTFVLSVRPGEGEALLFASLYARTDCMGSPVQSRIVAIHPPAASPVPGDAGSVPPGDAGSAPQEGPP